MKSKIIEKMYEISKKPYQKHFKKKPAWDISKDELLTYPDDSLGFHLGSFLDKNNFDIQPKLEDHDVIHILTETGVTVEEEIGMQYYLLGNGKKSLYLYMVIISGTLCYPTKIQTFLKQYKRGKKALKFYYLDFEKLLMIPKQTIQKTFTIQ